MYTFAANLSGLTQFSDQQIAVASRQYPLPAAKAAAKWLSKSIGRTVTIVPVVLDNVESGFDTTNAYVGC